MNSAASSERWARTGPAARTLALVGQAEERRHLAEDRAGIGDPRHLGLAFQHDDLAGDQHEEPAGGIALRDQEVAGGELRFGQAGAGVEDVLHRGLGRGVVPEQSARKMMRCKAVRGHRRNRSAVWRCG